MRNGDILGEYDVMNIFNRVGEVLQVEPNILSLSSPIVICGDIHGQYEDLLRLFEIGGPPDHTPYLFMGDYVDRGYYSLNTFLLLAIYKITYRNTFWLLRGNHETRTITQQYGFQIEIRTNYGHTGLWTKCMKVFDLLPIAAVIDSKIFSVHGGLSPQLIFYGEIHDLTRKRELPGDGILTDLTWSDPEGGVNFEWKPNSRGVGYLFGGRVTHKFCHMNELRLITRSHQIVPAGFQWHFKNDNSQDEGMLINVWSAPNYSYTSGNKASVLRFNFPGRNEFDLPLFDAVPSEERIKRNDVKLHPEYFA
jgi:diadenosine tetraphosphatase ApaH/serine/threonine PP2A family protein phosphatase